MSAVEFGDGREPWVVYRRPKVKRWLHALVRDVSALPVPWRAELSEWLADRDVAADVPSLLVTRDADGGGHRVHVQGSAFDVKLADLPVWLRAETPEPKPVKKAARAKPGG